MSVFAMVIETQLTSLFSNRIYSTSYKPEPVYLNVIISCLIVTSRTAVVLQPQGPPMSEHYDDSH